MSLPPPPPPQRAPRPPLTPHATADAPPLSPLAVAGLAILSVGWLALVGTVTVIYGAVEAYAECPSVGDHMFVKQIDDACRTDHIGQAAPWGLAAAAAPFAIALAVWAWRISRNTRTEAQ